MKDCKFGIQNRRLLSLLIIFIISCVAHSFSFAHNDLSDFPIDVIYHGSSKKNIGVIKPMLISARDQNEGAVVFATPSIRLASCYLIKWDDSWVHQFISWSKQDEVEYEVYMVISDSERFKKLDVGGAIYLLPPNNFTFNENKGLGVYEWTSKIAVKPYTQITFDSALDAMKTFGVKVYFMNYKQFKSYLQLPHEKQHKSLEKLDQS